MTCHPWSGDIPGVKDSFQELGVTQVDLAASAGGLVGCSPLAAPALETLLREPLSVPAATPLGLFSFWGTFFLCLGHLFSLFGACCRIPDDRPELQGVEEAAAGVWGKCGVPRAGPSMVIRTCIPMEPSWRTSSPSG